MKDDRDAADLSREDYIERLSNAKDYSPLTEDLVKLVTED